MTRKEIGVEQPLVLGEMMDEHVAFENALHR
jgi:hypothetical protein